MGRALGPAGRAGPAVLFLLAARLCRSLSGAQMEEPPNEDLRWEEAASWRDMPTGAVWCGYQYVHDDLGRREPAYVARMYRDNSLLPGKATLYGGSAATPNSTFTGVSRYEVAVAPARRVLWLAAAAGGIPPAAVFAGLTRDGAPLYSCRFLPERRLSFACGSIQRHSDRCVAEVEGTLTTSQVYEVLVLTPSSSPPYAQVPAPWPPPLSAAAAPAPPPPPAPAAPAPSLAPVSPGTLAAS